MTATVDHDLPMREYLRDPAPKPSMTASIAHALAQGRTPREVWQETPRLNDEYEDEDLSSAQQTARDIGSATHDLIFGGGEPMRIVQATDWRTKAAKEARKVAHDNGLAPVLEKDADRIIAMASAARERLQSNKEVGFLFVDDDAPKFAEATVMWEETGVWCRCRPDIYGKRQNGALVVVHYKTTATGLDDKSLSRFASNMGWDVIDAHYGAGISALEGRTPEQYFAVHSVKPPFLIRVVRLDPAFREYGIMSRDRALDKWAECVGQDRWPDYGSHTWLLEAPGWHGAE